MASIHFQNGTIIPASWLNDVNDAVYNTNAANIEYDPAGTGAVPTTVQAKLRQYISVKDFGATGDGTTDDTAAIQAAINYAQSSTSTPKNIHFSNGTYLVSATLNIKGFFADQGLLLYGDNAVIQSAATFGGEQFNVDALTVPDNLRCNVRFQNLNFYGPGKSVAGSKAIVIAASTGGSYVSADVWVKDAVVSGFANGIASNRGIILDFQNVTFKKSGLGFSSPDLSNSLTFTSCRFFSNDRALYINEFSLGAVVFNACEIEGNALGGTSTDGVKCCEFTNAGHLTFNGCHFESNNCQYNIHYTGTANNSSLTFIGCEVIAGLGAQVWATGALISSIGSFISSGASTYDLYMDANCHATLIDSYTTTSGSSAQNCTVIGGYSNQVATGGTAFRFLNRTASLDDYEATTWADASLGLVNCSSATLSNATYTKVGRQVTVYGKISATLTTTATAVSVVFNLPINTTANVSVAVGMSTHTLTTNGIGFVSDTTSGDPSQATLTIPANQVTVANGSAFTANFTFTYEA